MKYTTEEALSEILRRGERIAIRHNRRVCRVLSSTVCVLFASLLLVIWTFPEQSVTASSGTVYGAFLLSPEAGGYVLAVVIAFSLGVAVTLLCVLRQRRGGKHGSNQPDPNKSTRDTKGEQHETHS